MNEQVMTAEIQDEVHALAKKFIELANAMKNEGASPDVINGGLMFASCIYSTYASAGNEGYLHESGVEKVAAVYRRNLATLQRMKQRQAAAEAADQ